MPVMVKVLAQRPVGVNVRDTQVIITGGVSDEQVFDAVAKYLEQHPVEIETADVVEEGNMKPVTSNAVAITAGNVEALLGKI